MTKCCQGLPSGASVYHICLVQYKNNPKYVSLFYLFLQQAHSCMCMHGGVGGTAHVSKNCNYLLLMVASRQFLTYCPSFLYFSLCILCVLLQSAVRVIFIIFFMHIFFCRFYGKISISISIGVDRVHTKLHSNVIKKVNVYSLAMQTATSFRWWNACPIYLLKSISLNVYTVQTNWSPAWRSTHAGFLELLLKQWETYGYRSMSTAVKHDQTIKYFSPCFAFKIIF